MFMVWTSTKCGDSMSVLGMKIELTELGDKSMNEAMDFFIELGLAPTHVEEVDDKIIGLKYKEHEIYPTHEDDKWFITMYDDPECQSLSMSQILGIRDSLEEYVIQNLGCNNFGEVHVISKRLSSPIEEPITFD